MYCPYLDFSSCIIWLLDIFWSIILLCIHLIMWSILVAIVFCGSISSFYGYFCGFILALSKVNLDWCGSMKPRGASVSLIVCRSILVPCLANLSACSLPRLFMCPFNLYMCICGVCFRFLWPFHPWWVYWDGCCVLLGVWSVWLLNIMS